MALDETGDIPQPQRLRGQFPPGRDRDDAPARLRREARAAAVRRARDRLARGAARRRRAPGAARAARLRREGRGEAARALAGGPTTARPAPRVLLSRALPIAEQVVGALRAHPGADRVEVAGSLRRRADAVKDLDVIATAADPAALVADAHRAAGRRVRRSSRATPARGSHPRRAQGRPEGRRARPVRQRAPALHRLQGAQRRAARVGRPPRPARVGVRDPRRRRRARRCAARPRRRSTSGSGCRGSRPSCARAAASSRPRRGRAPAARHARGPARRPALPHDAVGRQARTSRRWSRARGRAATSTSRSPTTRPRTASATTSSRHAARARSSACARSTRALDGFTVLIGTETNVLPDGSLDYPDDLLAELDWVVASVHTSFGMREQDMTDRIVAAMEHPLVDVIGHPTGPQDRDARRLRGRHGRA